MTSMNNKPEIFMLEDMTAQILSLDNYVKHCAQQGVAAHRVEHGIWQQLLAVVRKALSGYLALCGQGDVGAEVKRPDGKSCDI